MGWKTVAYLAVGLVVFICLVLLAKYERHFAYFLRLRHSIVVAAVLIALPLAAWIPASRSVSRALFVLDSPTQAGVLTWICLMASTMVITTYWVTRTNADARLGTHLLGSVVDLDSGWNGIRWAIFFLLGLAIPLAAIWHTHRDWQIAQKNGAAIFAVGPGVLIGVAIALATLLLLAGLQRVLLDEDVTASGLLPFENLVEPLPFFQELDVAKLLVRLLPADFPGYVQQVDGEKKLVAGHAQLGLVLFFLLACYFSQFAWTVWQNQSAEAVPYIPALAYGVAILVIVLALLAGVSFFLDYYRLSTMATVVGICFLIYVALQTDHYFDPWPLQDNVVQPVPLVSQDAQAKITTVFDHWNFPPGKDGQRTLVVINASGGGIQASAWAGQVLTGLDERFEGFGESIGLISAVSGGSVGTMYYVSRRQPRTNDYANRAPIPCIDPKQAALVRKDSLASCLAATAWGMAFPDLTRVLIPPLVPQNVDRGWALESAWKHRLACDRADPHKWQNLRIMDWASTIQAGKMPVVVFNATRVETGQRVTISPVFYSVGEPTQAGSHREPIDFITNYQGSNPFVTTAVRLSATFSYVSPICRPVVSNRHLAPVGDPLRYDYHIADGGYADNEGLVTSLRWTGQVLEKMVKRGGELPFDRVLVVRIVPFPKSEPKEEPQPNTGLWQALLGPISCMNSVRVASQAERGDLELYLASRQLNNEVDRPTSADGGVSPARPDLAAASPMAKARQLRSRDAVQSKTEQLNIANELDQASDQFDDPARKAMFQREAAKIRLSNSVSLYYVSFQFPDSRSGDPANSDMDYQPPLSWKLTPSEEKQIGDSWKNLWKLAGQPITQDALGSEIQPEDLTLFFEEQNPP